MSAAQHCVAHSHRQGQEARLQTAGQPKGPPSDLESATRLPISGEIIACQLLADGYSGEPGTVLCLGCVVLARALLSVRSSVDDLVVMRFRGLGSSRFQGVSFVWEGSVMVRSRVSQHLRLCRALTKGETFLFGGHLGV